MFPEQFNSEPLASSLISKSLVPELSLWKSIYLPISVTAPTIATPPLCQAPLTGFSKLSVPLLVIVPPNKGDDVATAVTPLPLKPASLSKILKGISTN